jgi:hypothetical protein
MASRSLVKHPMLRVVVAVAIAAPFVGLVFRTYEWLGW